MKNTRQKYTSSFASPVAYSILYICHSFYKRISVLLLPHTTGTDWNRTRIVMVVLIRAPNGMFVVDVDYSNRDENVYDDDDDDDESSTL